MPRLSPQQIANILTQALSQNNASAVYLPENARNPRKFIVQFGDTPIEIWVYIWTLTHGGGAARPKNEYRIQITGVSPPFQLNPTGYTVLVGYEPNTQCFAGFDLQKHQHFSNRSPSIQIPITALNSALQYGLSFVTKGNDEIAIGIRPDQFFAYCLNAQLLHREGADASMVELLTQAASLEEIPEYTIQNITPERKRVIREVSLLSRNSNFRRKVTIAYDKRCAVTRMQLRLIDAAHILPVGVGDSSDEVENGLCLSPTYHRAYDQGLIFLDESLQMQINPAKEQDLIQHQLDGGLQEFKRLLGSQIYLPADRRQWPNKEFIAKANQIRGIK